MSFSETSRRERGPSVFARFDFEFADERKMFFTDADDDIFFEGNHYKPEPLKYSKITRDGTFQKQTLKLTARVSFEVEKVIRLELPSGIVSLIIREINFEDKDAEPLIVWRGRILDSKYSSSSVEFNCEPVSTSLRRPGLRRHYQRSCPHALYSDLCRAQKREFPVGLVSMNGFEWTFAPSENTPALDQFVGGYVLWQYPNTEPHRRAILSAEEVAGNYVFRLSTSQELDYIPTNVRLVRGCDRTETACRDWHNNILNFGGCPFIPLVSPVDKYNIYY